MSTREADDDVNVGMRPPDDAETSMLGRGRYMDVGGYVDVGRYVELMSICGRRQPGMSDVGRHSVFALFISSKLRDQGQSASILYREIIKIAVFLINIMMASL